MQFATPSNNPSAPSPSETKYVIQEAMAQMDAFWTDDEWTLEKLYALFRSFWKPENVEMGIETIENHLKKNPSLNDVEFRQVIHQLTTIQWALKSITLDPFTQAASMGIYPKMDSKALKFSHLAPDFFLEAFRRPGSFSYVTGPITIESTDAAKNGQYNGESLGVGKSNTAGLFMEMLAKNGFKVLCNYEIENLPDGIKIIRGLKEILVECLQNLRAGFFTVIVIDEFTQTFAKETGTASIWVTLKKFLYLLRKVGASLMVITQREQEVPKAIMQMANCHIQKLQQTVMRFRSGNDIYYVKEIPATSLQYNTYYFSPFKMDLDIEAMHERLADAKKGENQTNIILEYLQEQDQFLTKRDLMTFAKVAYLGGMSHQEIADWIHDMAPGDAPSRRTVGNWLKNMGLEVDLQA
jgi:hypothetical protein